MDWEKSVVISGDKNKVKCPACNKDVLKPVNKAPDVIRVEKK
jgi:hypothetical protein